MRGEVVCGLKMQEELEHDFVWWAGLGGMVEDGSDGDEHLQDVLREVQGGGLGWGGSI
jgi:hypothetical protein